MAEAVIDPSAQEAPRPQQDRIILSSPDDTVVLKQLVPEDSQVYYDNIAFDPDHLRQYDDTTADKYPDVESVRRSIEHPTNPDRYRFGIWDGDTFVGSDNITPEGNGSAELGSWISKKYIGNAYAGRGRKLLVGFAFDTLGLNVVHSDIVAGNEASRRSIVKSGFAFAGDFTDDDGTPMYRYVLTRSAWEAQAKAKQS